MEIQVSKESYQFGRYVSINRWCSYYYQINEVQKLKDVHSILLVGIGDGIVVNILKNLGYQVATLDFDKNLNPDIVGTVTDIGKIVTEKYDCIMCCQVLEHIPFEYLENVLRQFKKITNKNIIISLPLNHLKLLKAKIYLPFIHDISIKILIPKFWQHKYRLEKEGWGEHYYEIGINKKCNRKAIRKIMKEHFNIIHEFNPIENVYHVFFVLEK